MNEALCELDQSDLICRAERFEMEINALHPNHLAFCLKAF
jgi:hypothetical protein